MIRTGMVLEINNNKAAILTNDGQFLKVCAKKNSLSIGEIYTGEVINQKTYLKFVSLAASILLLVFLGTFTGFYFTPITTIEININPSIELKGNVFNRIIKVTPLNEDGEQIIQSTNLKNKTIDYGLSLIVEESKEQKFINDEYISSGKAINITIKGKKDSEITLDNFIKKIEAEELPVTIKSSQDKLNKGAVKIKTKNESRNKIEIKQKKEKNNSKKEKNKSPKDDNPKLYKKEKDKEKDIDKSNDSKKKDSSYKSNSNHKNTFKNFNNKEDESSRSKDKKVKSKDKNNSNRTKDNSRNSSSDKKQKNKKSSSKSKDDKSKKHKK